MENTATVTESQIYATEWIDDLEVLKTQIKAQFGTDTKNPQRARLMALVSGRIASKHPVAGKNQTAWDKYYKNPRNSGRIYIGEAAKLRDAQNGDY
jgi:hypothetical protein